MNACQTFDIGCHIHAAVAPFLWIAGAALGLIVLVTILIVLAKAKEVGGWPAVAVVLGGLIGLAGYILGRRHSSPQKPVTVVETLERKKAIQLALQARGLYSGPIDGIYGKQTHEAINRVERSLGLAPTPYDEHEVRIRPEVLQAIGISLP